MTIGEKIKKIRKKMKISQTELANRMHVKQQAISQFERSNNLKYETLEKIADALVVPVICFLDDDLYEAIDSFDDTKESNLLEAKFNEIIADNTLSKTEKEEKIKYLINQSEILENYHQGNIAAAFNFAHKHNIPLTSDIIIDADPETPLNKALQKERNGEQLTEEERKLISDYFESEQFKNAWEHIKKSATENLEHLKRLQTAYEQLNETGQDKVAEHAEMLAKIPEYRKEDYSKKTDK